MLYQYYQVLTKTKLDVILFEDMGAVNNYLLDYVHKQGGRVSKFYTVAMQSFFEDIATENNLDELNDVVKFLGEDLFNAVYPCALEFFYSNVYILDNDQTAWNAMDSFLKKNGMLLKADDKDYLMALRNSYMSIYEVLDFEIDKSITLKNLIEKNKKPITVSEKSLTHQIVKWDKLGLRLVSMKDGKTLIAGGGIPLSNEAAEESIKIIKAVTKELKKLKKNEGLQAKYPLGESSELLRKKIWVKEICSCYLMDNLNRRNVNYRDAIFNQDRHKIQYSTIHFQIKVNKNTIVKRLNAISELQRSEEDDDKYSWNWIRSNRSGESIIFATLAIKGDKLIINTNSEERALLAKEILEREMNEMIGVGLMSIEDINKLFEEKNVKDKQDAKGPDDSVPKEVEQEIINEYKSEYYKKWINMSLPALDGKTPKQASKIKSGREELIALLKDIENYEFRFAKDRELKAFNFDWLWKELGVEKEKELA